VGVHSRFQLVPVAVEERVKPRLPLSDSLGFERFQSNSTRLAWSNQFEIKHRFSQQLSSVKMFSKLVFR
jgi:hypothetical protein